MASQIRELKSILKPPRPTGPPQKSPAEARQIALAHARIIQQQKDLELTILDNIETLSTYPLSPCPPHSASSPSPSDTASFKSLIRPFQPSDYDDLISERATLDRCGYALCPLPPRRPSGGRYTLVRHNRPGFAIVEARDVERWCSDRCARRALYVKVQLAETAAWERAAMPEVRFDLYDEERDRPEAELAADVARLRLEEERRAKQTSATLSLERGDVLERGVASKTRRVPLAPKMDFSIKEKDITAVATPPKLETGEGDDDGHLVLEGHRIRFGTKAEESDSDGEIDA